MRVMEIYNKLRLVYDRSLVLPTRYAGLIGDIVTSPIGSLTPSGHIMEPAFKVTLRPAPGFCIDMVDFENMETDDPDVSEITVELELFPQLVQYLTLTPSEVDRLGFCLGVADEYNK